MSAARLASRVRVHARQARCGGCRHGRPGGPSRGRGPVRTPAIRSSTVSTARRVIWRAPGSRGGPVSSGPRTHARDCPVPIPSTADSAIRRSAPGAPCGSSRSRAALIDDEPLFRHSTARRGRSLTPRPGPVSDLGHVLEMLAHVRAVLRRGLRWHSSIEQLRLGRRSPRPPQGLDARGESGWSGSAPPCRRGWSSSPPPDSRGRGSASGWGGRAGAGAPRPGTRERRRPRRTSRVKSSANRSSVMPCGCSAGEKSAMRSTTFTTRTLRSGALPPQPRRRGQRLEGRRCRRRTRARRRARRRPSVPAHSQTEAPRAQWPAGRLQVEPLQLRLLVDDDQVHVVVAARSSGRRPRAGSWRRAAGRCARRFPSSTGSCP